MAELGNATMPESSSQHKPVSPIVAVGAVILKDNNVLLVKRGNEPYRGYWSIPGGRVRFGERIRDALRREVREETGLDVEIGRLVCVLKMIVKSKSGEPVFDYLILDYLSNVIGGELRPSSDVDEVKWVPLEDVDSYKLVPTVKKLLVKLRDRLM